MKKIIAFFVLLIILAAPLGVWANGSTTISIDTVNVSNAEDVAFVDINLSGNSGISAMTISFNYDAALEYIGFKEGIFSDYSVKDFADENYIRLVILEDADANEDGLLISLNFKLKNAEKGNLYPVSIQYSEGDFSNANGDAISPKIVSGGVAYLQEGTASQTPSKCESSSSSQVSETSSQIDENSISSTVLGSSQISGETEEKKDNTQSEITSSQSLTTENSNYPKWVIIPISLVLVAIVFYVILRNKK